MKRISIIICVMMLLNLGIYSITYAETIDFQDNANTKIDIYQSLEQSGTEMSKVTIASIKDERSFTAKFNNGDVNFFNERKYENGDIKYTITDGAKINVIEVKGANIYLDGEQVVYSENATNSVVAPMTMNTYINSMSPQASNYSVYDGYSNEYIQLPAVLQNVLQGAIITLISYVAPYAGIAAFVFTSAYSIIKAANPNTTKLYYRKYGWGYSGNNPLSGVLFYKYTTNWYKDSARTKVAESKTSYTMYVL